jgi:subtilisin family serine protease
VVRDPNNPAGSQPTGTSVAAPFVSGVAAMMRAVNPSIDNARTRKLMTATGWKGSGRVNVGVDAVAAVLAAMGGRLPPTKPSQMTHPKRRANCARCPSVV